VAADGQGGRGASDREVDDDIKVKNMIYAKRPGKLNRVVGW
jgi:hypothetical protein